MSNEASAWAFAQTGLGAGPKFLLVALANHADKAGVCYPGRVLLAEETECREQTVSVNLAKLEERLLIKRFRRTRRNGSRTSDWCVLAPHAHDRGSMITASLEDYPAEIQGATIVGPEYVGTVDEGPTSVERGDQNRKKEPSGSVLDARTARVNVGKIGGKPVLLWNWVKTQYALQCFNEATGRAISATTGKGQASESAKRIYSQIVNWPDLTEEQIDSMVRNTLASKWWGDGPPSVGVVFGPKVFEENMSRPAPKPTGPQRNTQDDE